MKDLVEYVAKTIVDEPDQVHVSEIEGENSVILELRVGPNDMGRVIGKGGRTANALRRLVRVLAAKQNKRATLEIV
ncbi:MAG: KH domain-containing protein [Anaerolineae bacterium]